MGKVFSALKADTVDSLQLDAGVILTEFDENSIETLTNDKVIEQITSKKCLGATKGGAQFSAVPEVRDLLDGIDGVRGAYKSTQTIDSWEITLKTSITELTAKNLEKAIIGAKKDKGASYKEIGGQVGVIGTDKFQTIAWVGNCASTDKPIIIVLRNALSTNGFNFTAEDKATGTVEMEFKAHFDLAKPNEVPFAVYTAVAGL